MREVAELADVSINTVSLTLKNSDQVRPKTREAVMAAVEQLGYVPNAVAQNLRSGSVRTIGILIPDIHNPHYWDIISGVEDEAQKHDSGVVVSSANLDQARERNSLRDLAARRYDGLILATHFSGDVPDGEIGNIFRPNLPVVSLSSTWRNVDRVSYYNDDAGLLLLNHLYELGHRRIGFVAGVARPGLADERINAYFAFTQSHNLPQLFVRCGPTVQEGAEATRSLLAQPDRPTAIISVNDLLALGVLRGVAHAGLRVPDDISVAGFDNTTLADQITPALTSIDVGGAEIGRHAIRLLIERIKNPTMPLKIVELPPRLVVRDSTAPPGGES